MHDVRVYCCLAPASMIRWNARKRNKEIVQSRMDGRIQAFVNARRSCSGLSSCNMKMVLHSPNFLSGKSLVFVQPAFTQNPHISLSRSLLCRKNQLQRSCNVLCADRVRGRRLCAFSTTSTKRNTTQIRTAGFTSIR